MSGGEFAGAPTQHAFLAASRIIGPAGSIVRFSGPGTTSFSGSARAGSIEINQANLSIIGAGSVVALTQATVTDAGSRTATLTFNITINPPALTISATSPLPAG